MKLRIQLIEYQFLLILAGLPAAGKSTFASFIKKALKSAAPNFKVEIIDPDSIRKEISSLPFNYEYEHLVKTNNINLIKEALSQGYIVISDDLNYYTSMRHDLKEIADEYSIPFFIVYISTPIETCLKWNNERGTPIPNEIIHRINEKFDPFDNYNWDKPLISFDFSVNKIHEALLSIINQIELELRDLNMGMISTHKKVTTKGPKEKLDTITRRIVGKFLNDLNSQNLKSKVLNLRKIYLKEKKGNIDSEDEISRDFLDFLKKRINVDVD